jgi:hypothetical protein
MAISENYDNDEILSELRMFVDLDEEDLESCLSQVEEVDENTLQIKVLDRVFQFDIELCSMEEVE